MDTTNSSKICRICCNRRLDDLVSLLSADSKAIVKRLRACADITIENDDLLPKYICSKCLPKLNCAYKFKIQCEYMDQKLRDTIASTLQKHIKQPLRLRPQASPSFDETDDESSTDFNSDPITMDDIDSFIEEELANEQQLMDDIIYLEHNAHDNQIEIGGEVQIQTSFEFQAPKIDIETNLMEISQKIAEIEKFDSLGSLPSVKDSTEECVDQEMVSVKSDNSSTPKNKRSLTCDTCGTIFYIHAEYNKHIKTHGKNRFQCVTCKKWFAKRYLLNAHQKTHSGVKNYECQLCQKRYTSQTNLDRHVRVFHRQERQHKCTTCHKTFSQLSTLRLHQSVHMAERLFSCDICNSKFKTETQLKIHKKRHMPNEHRRPRRKYTPPKKIYKPPQKLCVCNECGKRFSSLALLRSHMQGHSLEKKYECNFCKKRFLFHQSLRNHMFVHSGEKRFKCDICSSSFRQIGHLQGHKLTHSTQKPHTCTFCGKAFALRGNLTVHMRTHNGATPYQCNICSKQFDDSNGLKRHHLIHQQKNEMITTIEQILEAPIIEIPHTESTVEQPIFENALAFNVNPETIHFITPAQNVGDENAQLIFNTQ